MTVKSYVPHFTLVCTRKLKEKNFYTSQMIAIKFYIVWFRRVWCCFVKAKCISDYLCYTDKTREGAPCLLVANKPSAAPGFHKLLGFLWYIFIGWNSFINNVWETSWKIFSLFLVLTITSQLFLFFFSCYLFSSRLPNIFATAVPVLVRNFLIYICGIFQIEVATQVSWLLE